MTPKEKAIELVDKMYDTQGPEPGITYYEAIDCAKVAISEITSVIDPETNYKTWEFWKQVKHEIQQL